MGMKTVWLISLILAGCSSGHCRRQVDAPKKAIPVDAPQEELAARKKSPPENILIYKYDGSLQCKMGKAIDVETMAKELKGIPILTSVKKSDGLMHIQVCGSITGNANVYEIPAKFIKQAESKGFKKWSFE